MMMLLIESGSLFWFNSYWPRAGIIRELGKGNDFGDYLVFYNFNEHMKSEFYREVSHNSLTRKSTTHHKHKKESQATTNQHVMLMSKDFKSEKRSLIHSIDLLRRPKPHHDTKIMKLSYSKPLIISQTRPEQLQLNQKSAVSVCLRCEELRAEHERHLKALSMRYQQAATEHTEQFISMEKKYLIKEKEAIKLLAQSSQLLELNSDLRERMSGCLRREEELREQCLCLQQELARHEEEFKKEQDKNRIFSHFLTVFAEQTRSMLGWTALVESTQHPAEAVALIREELQQKKGELELMLRQSILFKRDTFGEDSIGMASHESSFLGSQLDGSESFMKYLRQDGNKTKSTKRPHFSQIKGLSYANESFASNKENIDTSNKRNFKSLIHSRLNSHAQKQRSEQAKEEYLRMLLTQAQSLEEKGCLETQNGCDVQNSCVEAQRSKNKSKPNRSLLQSNRNRYQLYNQ